jgi:thymidylate synthase
MEQFKGNNIPGLYTRILEKILNDGKEVGPRGLKTKELSPVCIEVTDPRRRLFGHPYRKDVSIFTYIEGLWMLKGEARPDRLVRYVPAMANFTNEATKGLDGAYGPAINLTKYGYKINQWENAYNRLTMDPDTRQAIIMINQPTIHQLPSKDYPCTLSFQFLLRNKLLDMIVTMRSQDAWLGLIYDTGEFQWFQEIMAGWLGVGLGRYIHIDGSLHLYERDWVKAREVVDNDANFSVYDKAAVLDARVSKDQFDSTLETLALWETSCRAGKFEAVVSRRPSGLLWKDNKFYMNLVTMIMAYNFRLEGYKLEAYELVQYNRSDLGIIYEQRWRPQ